MRLWGQRPEIDDAEERAFEAALREYSDAPPGKPPDAYWANLIIRTNARIDDVASGKGITFTWAARVAIPGVVAIISFLIALSYYVPSPRQSTTTLAEVVRQLPDHVVDSLELLAVERSDSTGVALLGDRVFGAGPDEIRLYCIEQGDTALLSESYSDEDVNQLLAMLGSQEK